MSRLRVAVVADLVEEGWPSMDLVAEMVFDGLRSDHSTTIDAQMVRPAMRRRAQRVSRAPQAFSIDRIINRFWDYPRVLGALSGRFDVCHVVDHSYAHLVHALDGVPALVTCHDLDTFRSVLEPHVEPRPALFRAMTGRILDGLRRAGHVACDTVATRDALVARAGVPLDRTSVVHNGPHPACTPAPDAAADAEAARLLGPPGPAELLHVGSTIPRKRIDVLLRVLGLVRRSRADARVVHVGGPLTSDQARLARELGVEDAVVSVPHVDRAVLAAIYRRSALLLLTSDREGFGLPVLEAMACGLPVVASDIPPLREVGGGAAVYYPPGAAEVWAAGVLELLDERRRDPEAWHRRVRRGGDRAADFSWARYVSELVPLYFRLAGRTAGAVQ